MILDFSSHQTHVSSTFLLVNCILIGHHSWMSVIHSKSLSCCLGYSDCRQTCQLQWVHVFCSYGRSLEIKYRFLRSSLPVGSNQLLLLHSSGKSPVYTVKSYSNHHVYVRFIGNLKYSGEVVKCNRGISHVNKSLRYNIIMPCTLDSMCSSPCL